MIDGYQRETNVNNRRGRVNRFAHFEIEQSTFRLDEITQNC